MCPAQLVGVSRTIIRFTTEVLTENGQDVDDVLARLQAAGVEQGIAASGRRAAPPCRRGAHQVASTQWKPSAFGR
ncbi:hypothetical protein ACF08M_33830 [Streptomyces sp. NPDC015032]|uniref:hypothetical protein n=1 Tax=Streptomyces sp. NPDC015032 TaxID=3364937 RepID=UPI003701800E